MSGRVVSHHRQLFRAGSSVARRRRLLSSANSEVIDPMSRRVLDSEHRRGSWPRLPRHQHIASKNDFERSIDKRRGRALARALQKKKRSVTSSTSSLPHKTYLQNNAQQAAADTVRMLSFVRCPGHLCDAVYVTRTLDLFPAQPFRHDLQGLEIVKTFERGRRPHPMVESASPPSSSLWQTRCAPRS